MTLDDYRRYIKRKIVEQTMAMASIKRGALRNSAGNTQALVGHQLQAASPFLERIRAQDPELGAKLIGYFKIFPKYSALEILVDEKAGASGKFAREVEGILEAVLTEEMRADGTEKRLAEAAG